MALATPPVVLESAPVVRALMVPAGVPPLVALVTWADVPVKVGAATVPAGVKATVPLVPAGVPALTAEVVT